MCVRGRKGERDGENKGDRHRVTHLREEISGIAYVRTQQPLLNTDSHVHPL